MSIASRIIKAISFTNLPCVQVSYNGSAETYFTFNLQAIPSVFADDTPDADIWLIQLHLYAPFTQDTTKLRRQVRKAIHEAGFTYPDMTDASSGVRSSDGTEQHIVFEFEDATGVGDDDD